MIKINNQSRIYDGIKARMTQFNSGKDFNAKALELLESRDKLDSITAVPGWKNESTCKKDQNLLKSFDGKVNLDDQNNPTAMESQVTRCSSIDIEEPSPIFP